MFPFLFLTISLLLPFIVTAYKIDASCEEKGIAADVRAAMGSAIQMVNAAYTTLAKPSALLTDDEVELIRNLFAKDGLEPAQLIDDGKMHKTNRLLYSIQHNMGQEVTGSNSVPDTDVIIYCHYDRWVPVEGKANLYEDTTNGYKLKFKELSCRGSTLDRVALAVTTNPQITTVFKAPPNHPEGAPPPTKFKRLPSQIQLCLWFVDWIKQKEQKSADDVKRRTRIGRKLINQAQANGRTWGLGLNQIDAFSLLDKVLLHEMTHARGAYSELDDDGTDIEGLKDVASPNFFASMLNWPSYGWEGAVRLARNGQDLGEENAPDNNADTIALFGVGSKLLADPNPRKIDSKGRIVPQS